MTTVYWLTRDLRLDDNPALYEASKASTLACVFIIDPRWFEPGSYGWSPMGPHRWAFTWQSLMALEASLQALGQRLIVRWQTPEDGIPEVVRALGAERVVASRPTAVDESRQWQLITASLPDVQCDLVETLTLFDEADLPFELEALPTTFSAFRRAIEKSGPGPVNPLMIPASLPAPAPDLSLDQRLQRPFSGSMASRFVGGEACGVKHLAGYLWEDRSILTYKETRNALDDWSASSKLSPWLASGALSARRVVAQIGQFEWDVTRNESTYWLYFELLWREYFQWYSRYRGSLLFNSPEHPGQPVSLIGVSDFKRWLVDPTTHILVRAGRAQLENTGYLSNRMRQILASACVYDGQFDWRIGAAWFEHFLVDYDVASNYGNWQYIAGVGADPRGGRVFKLDKQLSQFDPEGAYCQRWLGQP
ncbi:DASH family cryptochrome, partial [Saccharospirillum impatiens]|uniref:DASH family cryptochrome n=1 Tax=Saccharospirillum impatiens TaxID=169438 RepID=UPI00041322E4